MTRVRKAIDTILAWTLILLMGTMVLNVLWQVFSRYVLGAPSSFTDELARYLMIWLGVLGAAYAAGKGLHVAIDILPNRSRPALRKRLRQAVCWAIILFCFFALLVGGSRLVYVTYVLDQRSPALGLPLAFVYLVIPISGLLVIFYKTADLRTD